MIELLIVCAIELIVSYIMELIVSHIIELIVSVIELTYMEVCINGGTPIAGWFISWKIPL